MENHHFEWENPIYMTVFNSYVSLLEGSPILGNLHVMLVIFSRQCDHAAISLTAQVMTSFFAPKKIALKNMG